MGHETPENEMPEKSEEIKWRQEPIKFDGLLMAHVQAIISPAKSSGNAEKESILALPKKKLA